MPGDPYWSDVVLLMGFEGANNSTGAPGMNDESSHAHGTATVIAGATIDTSQFKFGTSSLHLAGTPSPYGVTFPFSADWQFGSGTFTIECWIRLGSVTANVQQYIVVQWAGISNLGWILEYGNSGSPSGTG